MPARIGVPWLAVTALLLALGSAAGLARVAAAIELEPPEGVAEEADQAEPRWQRLGSAGAGPVQALAVASTWPRERLLLAIRSTPDQASAELLRSQDGGATWQALPRPPFPLKLESTAPPALVLAASRQSAPVAFAVTDRGVYRSGDAGASWRQVLVFPEDRGAATLVLSPAFAEDGLAFVVRDGLAWRTGDGGNSWTAFEPAGSQRVQQVVFSPDFARDRTLFLATTSGPFRSGYQPPLASQPPPTDHQDSLGILVSTDGGLSWRQAVDGLEIDGEPFRQVRAITVSPTYAEDGTLFAFALGPWVGSPVPSLYLFVRGALFRSPDRGASWEVVHDARTAGAVSTRLALSPVFAADGLGVLAVDTHGYSPASGQCRVLRTGDGGVTWAEVLRPGSYEGCGDVRMLDLGGSVVTLVNKGDHLQSQRMSFDGGLSWSWWGPPGEALTTIPTAPRTSIGPVFVGTYQGNIWAFGAFGPCPLVPILGFGQVWEADRILRAGLGCPLGPERPIQLLERSGEAPGSSGPYHDVWPEDETEPRFARVYADASLGWYRKADEPWQSTPERSVVGSIQRFPGGTMLWLPREDGQSLMLLRVEGSGRVVSEQVGSPP